MIDRFGRDIDYLRISLTEKCNLKCMYCMPIDVNVDKECEVENLTCEDYKFLINSMSQLGISKIRFTGGEPLLYPKLNELIKFASEQCGIKDIGITTNGIGLYEIIKELKESGLNNVNISLNSLKEFKYKSITRGGALKEVLRSITTCLKLGIEVKINCVVIDGFNDDEIFDFIAMTNTYPIDIRFIELMPIGEAKKLFKRGYFDIKDCIENIHEIYKVESNKKSATQYYKLKNAKGRIGIIAPVSNSFCNSCNKIRLTCKGKIKLCLHSNKEVDIRDYLQKPLIFREVMKDVILQKPKDHKLLENQYSDTIRCMYEIGG